MKQRTEASSEISEFNLTEVGKEKVRLGDLVKTLRKTTAHSAVKKQLKNASRQKILPVPLSKPEAERIKRTVAYEKVSDEIGKWDNIVRTNRSAEQLVYPLKKPEFRLETAEEVAKRYQTKNALEEEVSKLLSKSENVLQQDKILTPAEERALRAMNLAEARARLAELRKMRALLSYKEAKARRQKKIKSKKYHRILKKERMKKLMKEFEELQKTDPEAAAEKIKEADKLRILERMTLKHRSTGKWAKQQKLRAKYNPESRVALKEQLNLGRQLAEKVIPTDISQSLKQNDNESTAALAGSVIPDDADDELLNMYRINYDIDHTEEPDNTSLIIPEKTHHKTNKLKPELSVVTEPNENGDDNLHNEHEELIESTERRQTIEDFDKLDDTEWSAELPDDGHCQDDSANNVEVKFVEPKHTETVKPRKENHKEKASTNYVSETDFSTETKFLESMVPDDVTFGDEDIDDVENDKMNIKQAFADEDFIAEFKEDKKAMEKKERPEGIDLFLPGWGSWGGAGIKPSKRKRRRFYVKPVAVQRKDSTLGNVIISEEKDAKASTHQVSELPFPYKSIESFQSIIRQPVGNTWNPETSFQKLVAPRVVTKMGKIIDPIDMDDVALQKKPSTDTTLNVHHDDKRPTKGQRVRNSKQPEKWKQRSKSTLNRQESRKTKQQNKQTK